MKRIWIVLGVVIAAASACGGGSLGNGGVAGSTAGAVGTAGALGTAGTAGTAGTVGTAGVVGSAGAIGTAGASGTVPACGDATSGAADVVETAITASDETPVEAPLTAAVTVTGIVACTSVRCPPPTTTAATRFTLAGTPGQQWLLYLRNTAMPPDAIKVGDTFDLTVDASVDTTLYRTVDQTIVLARDGSVMALAASLQHFFRPSVPDLRPFSIAAIDEGALCQDPIGGGCIPRRHTMRVSMGSDASILLNDGQTKQIGDLSFTLGRFSELADPGSCDTKSPTAMAAFRLR